MRYRDLAARMDAQAWTSALLSLGALDDATVEAGRRGSPCPFAHCGGTDRFMYDNRRGRGNWMCRHGQSHFGKSAMAGDGFDLLMGVFEVDFRGACDLLEQWLGGEISRPRQPRQVPPKQQPSILTPRAAKMIRTSCPAEDCTPVVSYLRSRHIWPLTTACSLRAHVSVPYYSAVGSDIGHYPAMLASAVDIQGAPVTAHVTYLSPEGDKVNLGEGMPSRKMLGPVGGHEGVSVRLTPLPRVLALGGVLGIAEGLETALSASLLNLGMPVWAALNTALLSTFVPPDTIRKLIIFADNDVAGMKAAWKLRDRVNLPCELRVPGSAHKDFNDQLRASKSPHKKTPNLPN